MMWKTFIFLAITSAVLAGRIKKHQANYKFYIKHDYDYLHHKHDEHEEHHKDEQKDAGANKSDQEGEQQENGANESGQEQQEQNGSEQEQGGGNNEENSESQGETETQEQENHKKDGFSAYEILYKVKDPHTHDMKGLHEKKYGDEIKGTYWLIQPDGYKRTVEYHADKHSGFHAKVDFSKFEEHHSEEGNGEGEDNKHHVATSEYYVSTHHELRKPTPIKEESQEQENQEESVHRPIYVV